MLCLRLMIWMNQYHFSEVRTDLEAEYDELKKNLIEIDDMDEPFPF